jgi:transposase
VVDRLSLRLVPDQVRLLVEPLLPGFEPRPQGGGTAPLPARAVFTAIVYVPARGCSWRDLPPSVGVPFQTAHRRSKIHVLSERRGMPLAVVVSAANAHDSRALKPLVNAIPAVKSRRGPRRRKLGKLHADKAYDQTDLHRRVRNRGIGVRIARKGIESPGEFGKHRWAIAWFSGYRA